MMMPASPSRVAVPCRFWMGRWGGHIEALEVWENMASSVDFHYPKKPKSGIVTSSKHRVTQIPVVDHSILVRPLE